ncbi:MAG: ATP-binding cassette domain-containing protein [Nitrospira sp.]|nr:ATP-binding cassette domain-containing protein [bacterium]MBL7050017.1 ATP-binding cassette domain-containing protein [Nitrospira sp.]
MALLSLQNIKIAFGGPEILDGLTLHIEPRERVCLVGRNGAGKSTLMKIINGMITPDSGSIVRSQGLRIAMLEQDVPRDIDKTVYDTVREGIAVANSLLVQYSELSDKLESSHDNALLDELERLQHALDACDGWQAGQQVETVLSQLKLDPSAMVKTLSGGQVRRVLLARALVAGPDLLLLDEPTNHLDIESITWLEDFLKSYRGSIFFITHDRRFLQTLATRIVELDRGALTDWPGDYQTYLNRKQALLDAEDAENARFDKKLSQEEAWLRQGVKARRTRNEGRVRALQRMRNERTQRRELTGSAKMSLNTASRSGKVVFEADKIGCAYGEKNIFHDFSTVILRGDKVGIIGPNGSGKTTLINILIGNAKAHTGTVKQGSNVEVAWFDQQRERIDEDKSVMENVADGEHVTVNGRTKHIIGYLQDFLFPPERAREKARILSGGERNRLMLAKIFTRPSNVLVLDEPTNDLDSDTLDLLEDMLVEYEGTVLLISHDRAFLDNTVTSTIVFEGAEAPNEYVGGYDDWLRQRPDPAAVERQKGEAEKMRLKNRPPAIKLTFKENRELESLPPVIEGLEAEHAELFAQLSDPELYKDGGEVIAGIKKRIEKLETETARAYERWESLEKIRKSSE